MEEQGQPQQQFEPQMQDTGFKVNIYPVMYWALAFGAIFAIALWLLVLLARFVTIVWFPVFLAGLVWGGYRSYSKQKTDWSKFNGMPRRPQSAMNEFKEAAQDIWSAGRTMMAEQRQEDQAYAEEEAYASEEGQVEAPEDVYEQEAPAQFESAPIEENYPPQPLQENLPPQPPYPPQNPPAQPPLQ